MHACLHTAVQAAKWREASDGKTLSQHIRDKILQNQCILHIGDTIKTYKVVMWSLKFQETI